MELRVKEANARGPPLVVSPRSKTARDEKELVDAKISKRHPHDNFQQNDDDESIDHAVEVEEEEWSDSDESDDDAKSCTSNQTEDDDDDDDGRDGEEDPEGSDKDDTEAEQDQENDRDDIHVEEKKEMKLSVPIKIEAALPPPVIRAVLTTKPVPAVLSVPALDANKRGIHEPRPPRGSGMFSSGVGTAHPSNKTDGKKARQMFQFPDAELLKLVLEEDTLNPMRFSSSTSSRSGHGGTQPRRRFSSTAAVMGTSLPLRRKSFTLTKGPIKSPPASASSSPASLSALPPVSPAPPSRFQARRKSTSAAYSLRGGAKSPLMNKNLVSSLPPLPRAASASPLATSGVLLPASSTSSASSQMVVRVRERKSDGRPEVVISKRPARFLVWNWNDRQIRVPFNIQLGPHQHGIMLRQLRYVKSVMNDFPWAKTHLKDLLAAYTKKDMTKEELYPQLNLLSHQVQQEIGGHVKKQKNIMVKKQRLTMQLGLATSVINEMNVTKYGRRGKPHDTKLYYDPGQPTKLQWIRKNGDRSSESLEVDLIEMHCYDADSKASALSAGMKKAIKKFSQTASLESCVSLVTPLRTLDVQLKSTMHREWLMNALSDVISFARQYRAAGARRDNGAQHQQSPHVLRRM